MGAYILRRLALIIPTLFGIMLISFTIVQFRARRPRRAAMIAETDQP